MDQGAVDHGAASTDLWCELGAQVLLSTSEPVYWLTGDGRLVDGNAAACRFFGRSAEELRGLHLVDLDPDREKGDWPSLRQQLTRSEGGPIRLRHQNRDGRVIPVELRAVPLHREDGGLICVLARDLSADHRQNIELEHLNRAQQMAALGHWRLERSTRRTIWSRQMFRIFKRDPGLGVPSADELAERLSAAAYRQLKGTLHRCLRNAESFELELELRCQDGSLCVVRVRGEAVRDRLGWIQSINGILQDISGFRAAERASADAKQRLELAVSGGHIGLYSIESGSSRSVFDSRCQELLGFPPGEPRLDWEQWRARMHPDDQPKVDALRQQIDAAADDRFEAEYRIRNRSGGWSWMLDRARAYERDRFGRVLRYAGTLMDVTRRKEAELKLAFLVDHDELTGLQNRRGILRLMQSEHARCLRRHAPHCLAILDLDRFKRINDSFGHAAGDEVLRAVADCLRQGLRQADWVGRWGGEEFVVVLPDTTESQALVTMERLCQQVAACRVQFNEQQLRVTLSVGVAAFRGNPGETLETVLSCADAALYKAKSTGRNRVCFSDDDPQGTEAVSIAVLVRDALHQTGIYAAHQPIVALSGRRVMADEILARILTADGRILPAGSFVQVAEQLGLLGRIDAMLLRSTLARLAEPGGCARPGFVHVSGDLLRQPEQLAAIAEALYTEASGSAALVLTIDESQISAETDQIAKTLAPLLRAGCRLAVAGFGGERASFRLLTHLPISFLEIDHALVRLALFERSYRARRLLEAICEAAEPLGVTTIAKRVEDESTAEALCAIGIDWASGFLFGRPSDPTPTPLDFDPA